MIQPFSGYLALGPYGDTLAAMRACLDLSEGMLKLTGPPGCGKSALCEELGRRLESEGFEVLLLTLPPASCDELDATIRRRFCLNENSTTHRALSSHLQRGASLRLVIILDDAHAVDEAVFQSLRLLSNIQARSRGLVQLVLAGTPALDLRLASPTFRSLAQHIHQAFTLAPLTREQSLEFCLALMARTGLERHGLESRAGARLHAMSGGQPGRLIAMWNDLVEVSEILPPTITARTVRELVRNQGESGLPLEPATLAVTAGAALLVAGLGVWLVSYLQQPLAAPPALSGTQAATTGIAAVAPLVNPGAEVAGASITALATEAEELGETGSPPEFEALAAMDAESEAAGSAGEPVFDGEIPALPDSFQSAARESETVVSESEIETIVYESEETDPAGRLAEATIPEVPSLEDFTRSWLDSWQAQDLDAYFAHYHAEFSPLYHGSPQAWRDDREAKVLAPPSIILAFDRFEIVQQGEDSATLRFWMRYDSPGYADETWKELRLRIEDGRWLILIERNLETNILRRAPE